MVSPIYVVTYCRKCNKKFKVLQVDLDKGWSKYCSNSCRYPGFGVKDARKCRECGKEFIVPVRSSKTFCSNTCSAKSKAFDKVITTCLHCNKEIKITQWQSNYQKRHFCNQRCFQQYNEQTNKSGVICATCNKKFTVGLWELEALYPRKYCSRKCMPAAAEMLPRVCTTCGKDFKITKWRAVKGGRSGMFCSPECVHKDPNRPVSILKGRTKADIVGDEGKARALIQASSEKRKGKDFIEQYGEEKARALKLNHSIKLKGRKPTVETRAKISSKRREGYLSGRIQIGDTAIRGVRIRGNAICQENILFRSAIEYIYNERLKGQSNNGKDFIYFYEIQAFELQELKSSLTPDFILIFDWNIDKVKEQFGSRTLTRDQMIYIFEHSNDWKFEEVKGYLGEGEQWKRKEKCFKVEYPDANLEIIRHEFIVTGAKRWGIQSYEELMLLHGRSKAAIKYRTHNNIPDPHISNSNQVARG